MRADVVLGVDIGTTATKAVAYTADGVARAGARAGYRMGATAPGHAEEDAGEVAAAVIEATRTAAERARAAGHRVAALAFSAAMHSLIAVDARGVAITPVVTWGDRRAAPQAARLRAEPGARELHQRTGTPVHAMSPLVKLRWFAEERPELHARAHHWLGIKEYVLLRLTGRVLVDHGVASGTGMYGLATEDWDPEALALAGVTAARLPRLVAPTEMLDLRTDAARDLGLAAGTPVVVGGADGPLANVGLGAIHPGTVACSIGTSAAVRVVADGPAVDDRGRTFCYVLAPGRYVVGGAINAGGIVLDWLAGAVAPDVAAEAVAAGGSAAPALLELAARAPAGSAGLLFLPYLLGERAPHWSGDPSGVYLGLTREHGREHLVRAAVEGVCLQLAIVLAALGEAGVEVREIRATGGFARSALWRRMLAGAFGRPIGFVASPEASSLGAAVLGMTAIGMLDSLDRAADLVAVAHTQEPDRAEAEAYGRLLPVFDAAYDALAGSFAALAEARARLPSVPR